MIPRILVLLFLLLLAAPAGWAQTAPNPAGISPDQARTALDVLNDPNKRAAFAATLDAIVKAQPPAGAVPPPAPALVAPATAAATAAPAPAAAEAKTPPAPAAETKVEGLALPLAPDSLGAQVLVTASDFVNRAGLEGMDALRTVQSVPLLWDWAVVMVTNAWARDLLLDVAWRVGVALAAMTAVEYALGRLMRRPIASLEAFAPASHPPAGSAEANAKDTATTDSDGTARAEIGAIEPPAPPPRRHPSPWTVLRRVPLVLARFALELVPVLGLAITGHLIAGSGLGGQTVSRLAILAVTDAYAVCEALLCIARMLFSPHTGRMRLLPLPGNAARYIMRWLRRFVLIAVWGYVLGEVGLLLGVSDVAHDALQKTVGLLLHLCLAIIVLQNRRQLRTWLRAPDGSTGVTATVRNRLAAIWHWIALFFIGAIWLVYAVEVPHGFTLVLRYFGLSMLVLILARLLLVVVLGTVDRALRIGSAVAERYPGLDGRLRLYHPALNALLRALVYALAALSLLQIYGLGTLSWLVASTLGQRIISALVTLSVTILAAFTVWEGVNAAIQNHLSRLQRQAQMARSARLRTLLPLLRSTLLISVVTVAGLMILSEIGVNIAPLLAGAGIVGVAIGFGSQKLVQDLITGIFLLLENAMQVGDWVTVSGLSGSVEALSVRTIRLRAGDGSVHIIPFSAVTSVTNVNRGLGNASVNVTVDYEEDTDRVGTLLKEIVAGMRAEKEFSAWMLSDLQLWGVDKVDGAGVTIAGQVVCTDSGRWAVQREFNRRMKKKFQELGIRIYNPMRNIAVSGLVPQPLDPGTQEAPHGERRAAD